jgi:hypothetical protein
LVSEQANRSMVRPIAFGLDIDVDILNTLINKIKSNNIVQLRSDYQIIFSPKIFPFVCLLFFRHNLEITIAVFC